jgi:hypothetical protein
MTFLTVHRHTTANRSLIGDIAEKSATIVPTDADQAPPAVRQMANGLATRSARPFGSVINVMA